MNKEQDKADKNRKRRERYHENVKKKEVLNEKRRKRDATKSKNEKKNARRRELYAKRKNESAFKNKNCANRRNCSSQSSTEEVNQQLHRYRMGIKIDAFTNMSQDEKEGKRKKWNESYFEKCSLMKEEEIDEQKMKWKKAKVEQRANE